MRSRSAPSTKNLFSGGSAGAHSRVATTGPRAYRRPDGIAVVPLALMGP